MIDAILFTVALFAAALTIYSASDWLAYRRRLRADAELAGVLERPANLPPDHPRCRCVVVLHTEDGFDE